MEETISRGRKRSREKSRSSERNRSVQRDYRTPWDSDNDQIKTNPNIEDLTDENCNRIEPEEKVFEKVNAKLNEVLGLMFVSPPTASKVIDESEVLRKIEIIKSKIKVNNVAKELSEAVNVLKELTVVEQREAVEIGDVSSVLKTCRNLKEVTEKVSEFEFKDGSLICVVCGGMFECPEASLESSEKAKKLSRLKFNLKEHLKTVKHTSKLADDNKNAVNEEKLKSREQAIAEKMGAICYFTIHTGRPDSDFPLLVYLSTSFGVDLGDLNHSKNFPAKFCPNLAEVNLGVILKYFK